MIRRSPVVLVVALVVTVATGLWTNAQRRVPVVKNRPLTYWLRANWLYVHGGQSEETPEAIMAAFAEMDARSVSFLTQKLDWKPSSLIAKLNLLVNRVIDAEPFHGRPDYRAEAAIALGRLGQRATSAIPALEELSRRYNTWETESGTCARGAAVAALILLRHEPVEAFVTNMLDYSDPSANEYAEAIVCLGTNAATAVPLLVKAMQSTGDDSVKCRAAGALGDIHSHPELTVPALASLLTHTKDHVRWYAVRGLESFGHAARPAWEVLVERLNDSDDLIRQRTTNAILKID